MSIIFIVQAFFALLVIGIALWTMFCLLKELLPHKKIMAGFTVASIVGVILYSQIYKSSDADDSSQVYEDEPKGLLSFFNNNESSDDEEYEDNCSELPQYCYEMTSCSEAEEAFECGNYDLDGDDDGVPCESLCGSY